MFSVALAQRHTPACLFAHPYILLFLAPSLNGSDSLTHSSHLDSLVRSVSQPPKIPINQSFSPNKSN